MLSRRSQWLHLMTSRRIGFQLQCMYQRRRAGLRAPKFGDITSLSLEGAPNVRRSRWGISQWMTGDGTTSKWTVDSVADSTATNDDQFYYESRYPKDDVINALGPFSYPILSPCSLESARLMVTPEKNRITNEALKRYTRTATLSRMLTKIFKKKLSLQGSCFEFFFWWRLLNEWNFIVILLWLCLWWVQTTSTS